MAAKDEEEATEGEAVKQEEAPAIEERQAWVQCDLCDKWRRIPSSLTLDDTKPWCAGAGVRVRARGRR